jgi:hypothetical protein
MKNKKSKWNNQKLQYKAIALMRPACKNPHRHSAAGEESHVFLFNQKIKR